MITKKRVKTDVLVLMRVMAASFWIYKQIPISLFHPAHHLHCTNCKQTLDHLYFWMNSTDNLCSASNCMHVGLLLKKQNFRKCAQRD